MAVLLAFVLLMSSLKLSCWYYRGSVRIDTSDPLLFIAGQSQVFQIFGGGFRTASLFYFQEFLFPLIAYRLIGPI